MAAINFKNMSIVFSAIVPHSPILIPSVGKENCERLKNTRAAFKKLEEDLYASKAETIIIFSPHGLIQSNSFSMNLSPEFIGNFEEFGDFSTKFNLKGDIGLAYRIREKLETKVPLQLVSETKLDYGSAIPLYLLTANLPQIKIIPFYYSGLDLASHYGFGQILRQEILASKERVAVIASGDLSHRLSKDAPAGYSAKGKKFDNKIIESLEKFKIKNILGLEHEFIRDACECGLKAIVMLLGILEPIKCAPQKLSYESPFGVGYLVMNFKI